MLTKSWPCVRKPIGKKKLHFKIWQNVNAVCARQANRDWQAFNKRSSCAAVSLNQPSSPLQWNIFFHTIWKSSALNGGQVFPSQPCFLSVISIELEEAHYRPVADGRLIGCALLFFLAGGIRQHSNYPHHTASSIGDEGFAHAWQCPNLHADTTKHTHARIEGLE